MTSSPWPLRVGDIELREARAGDIDGLLAWRNLPEVTRWLIHTEVDPERFRRDWLEVPDDPARFHCVAVSGGRVVAIGFLDVLDGMGQPGTPPRTDGMIGYLVAPGATGRGVATAVARGLLEAAFDRLGLRRVVAGCYADNLPSVRVLEKVGLRREQHGIRDSWHAELGWVDGYTYGLLAEEWRSARG